jgi:hypothetical protein
MALFLRDPDRPGAPKRAAFSLPPKAGAGNALQKPLLYGMGTGWALPQLAGPEGEILILVKVPSPGFVVK